VRLGKEMDVQVMEPNEFKATENRVYGLCSILQNGIQCQVRCRGFACSNHQALLDRLDGRDNFELPWIENRDPGHCHVVENGITCGLSAPGRGYACQKHVALVNHLDGVPTGTRRAKRIQIAKQRLLKKAKIVAQPIVAEPMVAEPIVAEPMVAEPMVANPYPLILTPNNHAPYDAIEQSIMELRNTIDNQRKRMCNYHACEKHKWTRERVRLLADRQLLLAERDTLLAEKAKQDVLLAEQKSQQDHLHAQNKRLELEQSLYKNLQGLHEKALHTIEQYEIQIKDQENKLTAKDKQMEKFRTCFQEHDVCIKGLNSKNINLQAHCDVLQARLASAQQNALQKWNQAQNLIKELQTQLSNGHQMALQKWNHAENQITDLQTKLAKQNIHLEYVKCQLQSTTVELQNANNAIQQAKRCWVCDKPSQMGQCSVH